MVNASALELRDHRGGYHIMSRAFLLSIWLLFATAIPLTHATAAVPPLPFSMSETAISKDVQRLLD